jgi:hypothetical protein
MIKGVRALQTPEYLPHVDLLLQALRVNRERLHSKSKIAIDARLLRSLLQAVVARAPFSAEFYLQTYPDIADAHAAGDIPDLHRHYVESGFFEGRFGAPPAVDEAFYTTYYKDIGQAVTRGDVASATEHYLRQGAAEGRIPNRQIKPEVDYWISVLRDDTRAA